MKDQILKDVLLELGSDIIDLEITSDQLNVCYQKSLEQYCINYHKLLVDVITNNDSFSKFWIRQCTLIEAELILYRVRSKFLNLDNVTMLPNSSDSYINLVSMKKQERQSLFLIPYSNI